MARAPPRRAAMDVSSPALLSMDSSRDDVVTLLKNEGLNAQKAEALPPWATAKRLLKAIDNQQSFDATKSMLQSKGMDETDIALVAMTLTSEAAKLRSSSSSTAAAAAQAARHEALTSSTARTVFSGPAQGNVPLPRGQQPAVGSQITEVDVCPGRPGDPLKAPYSEVSVGTQIPSGKFAGDAQGLLTSQTVHITKINCADDFFVGATQAQVRHHDHEAVACCRHHHHRRRRRRRRRRHHHHHPPPQLPLSLPLSPPSPSPTWHGPSLSHTHTIMRPFHPRPTFEGMFHQAQNELDDHCVRPQRQGRHVSTLGARALFSQHTK